MSFIISRKMKSEDNPRTPPPSRERIPGMRGEDACANRAVEMKQRDGNYYLKLDYGYPVLWSS